MKTFLSILFTILLSMPIVGQSFDGRHLIRYYDISGNGEGDIKVTYIVEKKDGKYNLIKIKKEKSDLKIMIRR